MKASRALLLALSLPALSCAGKQSVQTQGAAAPERAAGEPPSGLRAIFETERGSFEARLFHKEAPRAVERFKALAQARRYDGAPVLRVIPGFLVQAGALSSETSAQLPIEPSAESGFDRPGLLALAAADDGVRADQFFVTLAAAPWLAGKNTVFGEVVSGLDTVRGLSALERLERDPATGAFLDRPVEAAALKTVRIEEAPVPGAPRP